MHWLSAVQNLTRGRQAATFSLQIALFTQPIAMYDLKICRKTSKVIIYPIVHENMNLFLFRLLRPQFGARG